MILPICHERVAVAFFIGEDYLTLFQIPVIYIICKIQVVIKNIYNMHLLSTKSVQGLDINLILWWISSAIEVEPSNEKQGNSNELTGRVIDRIQRMLPVVFQDHVRQQSIQKERKQEEDVPHVNSSYSGRQLLMYAKMIENAGKIWSDRHLAIVSSSKVGKGELFLK